MKFTKAVELKHNGLLRKVKNGFYQIEEQFVWYLNYENKREFVIVPRGFKTNFGSIPKWFRGIFDYMYLTFVLHDYLYSKKGNIQLNSGINADYTRYDADKIMLEGLLVEGYGISRSILAFIGVRLFGFLYFKK